MALIHLDHVPQTVKVNLPLNIILPDPGEMGSIPLRDRKVLYLLHGLSDDASAWQRYSAIEALAHQYGVVVVMPSAGRSFYMNQPNGQCYFSYLVEELPQYLEDVFGLVPRRENTFIVGNSMGGYGAFKAALLHPERYAAAASLSGALSLEILNVLPNDPRQAEFSLLFGDLSRLASSEHDPITWLQRAAQNPAALPRLYMTTARQEDLYPVNQMFYAASRQLGLAIDYHEADGQHDWLFWDAQIRRILALFLA